MRVVCNKSGVEFATGGFNSLRIANTHPLIGAQFHVLEEAMEHYHSGKLSNEEKRVLFIALLDSTQLVEFRCACAPTRRTIARYMEYLYRTALWKYAIGERLDNNLARIAINTETRELKNIGTWLLTWNIAKREATSASHAISIRVQVQAAEEKLLRMLRNNKQDADSFKKMLCDWFLTTTAPHSDRVEEWSMLFLAKRPEIWNNKHLPELEDMLDWAEGHLIMNSSYAMFCLRHITKQRNECRDGVLGAIGGGTPNEYYTILQQPILDDDEEIYNDTVDGNDGDEEVAEGDTSDVSTSTQRTSIQRTSTQVNNSGSNGSNGSNGYSYHYKQVVAANSGSSKTVVRESVEQANMRVIAHNAPVEEPQEKSYSSKFAFLKAKSAWRTRVQYFSLLATQEREIEAITGKASSNNNVNSKMQEG